jgi:hypothetical protein
MDGVTDNHDHRPPVSHSDSRLNDWRPGGHDTLFNVSALIPLSLAFVCREHGLSSAPTRCCRLGTAEALKDNNNHQYRVVNARPALSV